MTWGQGSRIPAKVKAQVRRRDRVCQLGYPGCEGHIDEFDHRDGLAEQGLQRTAATATAQHLRGVCSPCHRVRSEQQRRAGIAQAVAARGSVSRRYREREPHPGRITK